MFKLRGGGLMQRVCAGHYEITSTAGEEVRASARHVFAAFCRRPLNSISQLSTACHLSFPTTAKALEALVDLGIVREITGGRRNRLFAYDGYLTILSEGADPL